MSEVSIPVSLLNAALRPAKARGYNIHLWLRQAGIPQRLLDEPNARISASQYSHVQALAIKNMDDELLGSADEPIKAGASQALCHWLITTKTLAQAMHRLCQFYQILGRGFLVSLDLTDQAASLRFQPWSEHSTIQPFAYEHFMFGHHRVLSWLTSHDLPVLATRLNYAEPEHLSDYRFMFPRASITFDCLGDGCELVFDRKWLELPVRQTQENLALFLRRPLFNILTDAYSEQSWTARTREALQRQLSSTPSLVEIAEKLDVHPKRLRRRLKDEGIDYKDLKDQLRRDIAINALTQSSLPIEKIAELTGFAETSTFTRTFKRWTGVTPFTYRRKVGG